MPQQRGRTALLQHAGGLQPCDFRYHAAASSGVNTSPRPETRQSQEQAIVRLRRYIRSPRDADAVVQQERHALKPAYVPEIHLQ